MTITAVFVVFAVTWFLTLFVVLPIGQRSQQEDGVVVPGTPPSAPSDAGMKGKLKITTVIAVILTTLFCAIIISEVITIENLRVLSGR